MPQKLELKDILSAKKGIQIFLRIENDLNPPSYTDLRHATNLSYTTLDNYLNKMLDSGIIEAEYFKGKPPGKRNGYQLTEKGKKLSEPIKNICFAVQKLGEEIKLLQKE